MAEPLLAIDGLSLDYSTPRGWLKALDDVSLAIQKGTALGLVGESGSGKSSVVMALLGLLDAGARLHARRVAFRGEDLLSRAAALRGRRIGVVFQDSAAVLNPALTIGQLVTEPLRVHLRLPPVEARARALNLLDEMGIARPVQMMDSYPHQLSGGMKQRVVIATALATEPDLLLLDEPTTALDVTVEAQILDLLDRLRERHGLSMLLVSHNLGIVDRLCDRVAVLYAGRVVENGATATVLDHPRHPYTKGLMAALPRPDVSQSVRLSPIPGGLPDLTVPEAGCNFRQRCPFVTSGCEQPQSLVGTGHQARCHRLGEVGDLPWSVADQAPLPPNPLPQVEGARRPLVRANGLRRRFSAGGLFARSFARADTGVLAVDEVSISIGNGEIVGLVGESGCGKTTLGRLLLRLVPADAGTLQFDGTEIPGTPAPTFRRRAQIVLQNPDTALNPRQTVGTILRRPLQHFGLERDAAEIERLLGIVRLPASYAARYPHQLSGGEKQRVGIARALATRPDFLVCDEAVSALDVSVQAAVLNLLLSLRDELGLSYLFISHDIGVIAHVADRVVVMYRGSVVEEGGVQQVLRPPYHPYTELLLSSVPTIGRHRGAVSAERSTQRPDTATEGVGCKFAARCGRKAGSICDTVAPPWQDVEPGHRIRCHIPADALRDVVPWQRGYALERVTGPIAE
jgi:peptide/nickel transport system ATP-binding protein